MMALSLSQVSAVLLTLAITNGVYGYGESNHICVEIVSRVEPVAQVESVTTRTVDYTPCGECGCETCTLYGTIITNRTTYIDKTVYDEIEVCCSGWQGANCDIPVCNPACDSGRSCVAPNMCSCPRGYEGNDCSDIDECDENNGACQQVCVNTGGSYHCECDEGYKLRNDGRTCEFMCGEPNSKCFGCKRYEIHTAETSEEVDWDTAKARCEAAGGTLAMPKTSDIHIQIREYILSNNLDVEVDKGFWIGLHDNEDEDEFKWMDGSLLSDTGYLKWSPNNPNNNIKKDAGGQDCTQLWKPHHLDWDDDYCDKTKGFVCEFDIC
ncbi:epidermal growth factor-like protein 7 [Ptychodera flava]|uniref:epidermal growth factor-like protein 7 n=1 Tax=Ptychodera flava TaxID=63121 RepID=UPI003969E214